MTKYLRISSYIRKPFLMYDFATDRCNVNPSLTVLRFRIICLKKVHPGKRARAQELYIVSSSTYAFNETFTCVWIFLWSVSLEWQEAHLDDGFTRKTPPPPPRYSNDRNVLQACLLLAGESGPDWAILGGGTGVNFFCNGCF